MKDLISALAAIAVVGITGTLFYLNRGETVGLEERRFNIFPTKLPHSESGWRVKSGSVYDGDTLRLVKDGREIKVRLCGIDAPEKNQEGGIESRDYLRSLLPDGREVYLVRAERDRYGRVVGEIFVPGETEIHANSEMALRGMAYAYREYISSCPNGQAILTGEMLAKEKKVGVWSGDYELPSEFRRRNRK